MKELSIEEKAKRYDEALKYAMIYYKDGNEDMKMMMKTCFPVLVEESEDESIRKEIVSYLKTRKGYTEAIKDPWIAWLEKQGEQKSQRTISAEAKEALFDYENANIKQKDFAPNDEQKPTDKVEPKFCEGEWITNGDYTWKIVEVNPLDYILQSQDGNIVDDTISHVDEQFHSFTIQDAKDGDVLSYVTDEDLWIMIYRSLYEPYEGHVHYHALLVNDNFSDKGTCCICIDNLKPATKEQRDLLFSKMKEAGYEWDADRLELKKIEQKPAWSEDDKMMLQYAVDFISTSPHPYAGDILRGEKGKDEVIIWLKSLKQRVQPQPKQEWSEENEEITEKCIGAIRHSCYSHSTKIKVEKFLESLRPQNAWKPSESDIRVLEQVIDGTVNPINYHATLYAILEQLKKLREE